MKKAFIDQINVHLRPKQIQILQYQSGKMGISAVPGSGKTFTLSLLAAKLVAENLFTDEEEVLVVTLVNSAVDHFKRVVERFVDQGGLIPHIGYRVRTLHGLAHDIVRMRPELVGLSEAFEIVDESEAKRIIQTITKSWLEGHPNDLDQYLKPDLSEYKRADVKRKQFQKLVSDIACNLIRTAKDRSISPERYQALLDQMPLSLPLAQLGCDIYADYERALKYRGCVDFEDLMRLALEALQSDAEYLERLREQWQYILEDEAQDSSRLQQEILELLVGDNGNWVRVGDPNQAIYETFTTANPKYLHEFRERQDVIAEDLPNSGRSTRSIIDLANYLVHWTKNQHPNLEVRNALEAPPWIEPTDIDDPQPNPEDNPSEIHLIEEAMSPKEELEWVVNSLEEWLKEEENQEKTVAVLVARNERGGDLAMMLKERDIPCDDSLMKISAQTRSLAGMLANVLNYLAKPDSAKNLAYAYEVWKYRERDHAELKERIKDVTKILRKIEKVEEFLYPVVEEEWELLLRRFCKTDEALFEALVKFRRLVCHWQEAAARLPIDQLILTLAQDLLLGWQLDDEEGENIADENEQSGMALAHKLAVLLDQMAQMHPDWRLPDMVNELETIARSQRSFLGFSDGDQGFDPLKHKGKVVIATMHKAKGLEWQRVYILSANNYTFPSGEKGDSYIAERWYLRDALNLEAEALSQFEALFNMSEYNHYEPGLASKAARLEYIRERLRLFYVGITRAKEELIISWNTGRNENQRIALAFKSLIDYWNGEYHE
jgi:DNA helicase II / ATP-dependent DNA helicase PcrA